LPATATNKRSYVADGLVDGLIKIYEKGEIAGFEFVAAVCLTTYAQPLPKQVLQTVRSSASTFNFQYPFIVAPWIM